MIENLPADHPTLLDVRRMLENEVLADMLYLPPHPAQDFLSRDDFSTPDRQLLFRSLLDMRANGYSAPGLSPLLAWLAEHHTQADPRAAHALVDACLYTPQNTRPKIDYLKRLAARTQLSQLGGRLVTTERTTDDMLTDTTTTAQRVQSVLDRDDSESNAEIAQSLIAEAQQGPDPRSISTGIPTLDSYGLLECDSKTIIAARPSLGKTSLAGTIALHAAIQGHPVCYIAAEEPPRRIIARLANTYAGIARGAPYLDALATLPKLPLRVLRAKRIPSIATHAAAVHSELGLDLLIVDHLQELIAERRADRIQEINEILAALSQIASDHNVPLILLCQLSRRPEHRQDSRPDLADLRDSGRLEEWADRCWMLYRAKGYSRSTECIVRKNRTGPKDVTVNLAFLPPEFRFIDEPPIE